MFFQKSDSPKHLRIYGKNYRHATKMNVSRTISTEQIVSRSSIARRKSTRVIQPRSHNPTKAPPSLSQLEFPFPIGMQRRRKRRRKRVKIVERFSRRVLLERRIPRRDARIITVGSETPPPQSRKKFSRDVSPLLYEKYIPTIGASNLTLTDEWPVRGNEQRTISSTEAFQFPAKRRRPPSVCKHASPPRGRL